jgi:hypothetical protein
MHRHGEKTVAHNIGLTLDSFKYPYFTDLQSNALPLSYNPYFTDLQVEAQVSNLPKVKGLMEK